MAKEAEEMKNSKAEKIVCGGKVDEVLKMADNVVKVLDADEVFACARGVRSNLIDYFCEVHGRSDRIYQRQASKPVEFVHLFEIGSSAKVNFR